MSMDLIKGKTYRVLTLEELKSNPKIYTNDNEDYNHKDESTTMVWYMIRDYSGNMFIADDFNSLRRIDAKAPIPWTWKTWMLKEVPTKEIGAISFARRKQNEY